MCESELMTMKSRLTVKKINGHGKGPPKGTYWWCVDSADAVVLNLARIFHEYATIHLVAGMIAGIVAFTRKDNLHQAPRLPNANVF